MRRAHAKFYLLVILASVLPFSPSLWATEEITWMEADAPPFFIHSGPMQGQGYEDLVTKIIESHLPEYEHEKITANIARHMYNFQHGLKTCTVGFFKTPEREEIAYYSIPSFFTLPTVLIIKKVDYEKFGGQKTISLNQLFSEKQVTVGVAKGRSYGKYVDHVLMQEQNRKHIVELAKQELASTFFKMLLTDRIDCLLGLPEEAMYLAEQHKGTLNNKYFDNR